MVLLDSFPDAVEYACENGTYALVAAGYLDMADGLLQDSWVDLHFRYAHRMRLSAVWESPTKTMCLAVNGTRASTREEIRSVALHPATAVLARRILPAEARREFVRSKPLGVQKAADGEVDACVGSLDVVERAGRLSVIETMRPTMVWCLYQPVPGRTDRDRVSS
ncbi:hypothetical protein OOK27_22335 [Streptomyces canus]|uniref:hypothetical protein n=1 Tax=Streptomyces canus TaxID=58343 RepID=UPI00225217CC|nr:hypothetical protein [Streptomyces canus]MCX5256837.1 hypothetical protein [Streptomyces canus]